MNRWINAEWLLNFFEPYPDDYQTPLGSLRACVDDAPSIDIVHCGKCKWRDSGENDAEIWSMCTRHFGRYFNVNPDDFCSYGEREGE